MWHVFKISITNWQPSLDKKPALNKTKGVLILVDRKLHLTIEHTGNDDEGRFVFLVAKYIMTG